MTVTEKIESWQTVFETRDIDVEETEGPEERPAGWFQTLTRFSKRGFMRVVVSPGDDAMDVHVQLAVPGAGDTYANKLKQHLSVVSGAEWAVSAEERPWTLEAKVSLEESLAQTVDALQLVASHIERAEAGEDAGVLAEAFGGGAEEQVRDVASKDEDVESEDAPEQRDDAAAGGVFEPIGNGESREAGTDDKSDKPRASADGGPTGDLVLESYNLEVSDQTIVARLRIAGTVGATGERRLRRALERSLRARFDVKLMLYEPSDVDGGLSIELGMEPAGLGAADKDSLDSLSERIGRFFERLEKFNNLGLSLLDVLATGTTSASRGNKRGRERSSEQADRTSSRDKSRSKPRQKQTSGRADAEQREPHLRRREDQRRAQSETSGVVFSFAGEDLESDGSRALERGNFTDPRLRREDATTPLVDVVLRHPGYSDKSMRQVLSILLDIDYYEATKLAKDAPCVIAWGTSQERAREFKRVIENAGGKVTLVEPDSFPEA